MINELLLDHLEIKSGKKNITTLVESNGKDESDSSSDDCETFYPSVECGPISIRKATKELKFRPTELTEVIKECIKFNTSVDQS